MITNEMYDLQYNLTSINNLSTKYKLLSSVNVKKIYNNTLTVQDVLSDQMNEYLSVSAWLASPIIGMLNLVSGLTCDINNHITNLNTALGTYANCFVSERSSEQIDVQLDSLGGILPSNNTLGLVEYKIQNILLDYNNNTVSITIKCSIQSTLENFPIIIDKKCIMIPSNSLCSGISEGYCFNDDNNIFDDIPRTVINSCALMMNMNYKCPAVSLSDLDQLVDYPPLTPQGSIQKPICESAQSNIENEIQALTMCIDSNVENNNYADFIIMLNNTLANLEPFMKADCDTIVQQCVQDHADSVFL